MVVSIPYRDDKNNFAHIEGRGFNSVSIPYRDDKNIYSSFTAYL